MANTKKTTKNTNKKTTAKKAHVPDKEIKARKPKDPDSVFNRVFPYVLGILAVVTLFCLALPGSSGSVGGIYNTVLSGLFGIGAFAVPVLLLVGAYKWRRDVERDVVMLKTVSAIASLVAFSAVIQTAFADRNALTFSIKELWKAGGERKGGGVVGGLLGDLFVKGVDKFLTYLIFILLFCAFLMLFLGVTPRSIYRSVRDRMQEQRENLRERREEDGEEEQKVWRTPRDKKKLKIDRRAFDDEKDDLPEDEEDGKSKVDIDIDDDPPFETDEKTEEETEETPEPQKSRGKQFINASDGKVDLEDIFKDPEGTVIEYVRGEAPVATDAPELEVPSSSELELMVERSNVKTDKPLPEKEPEPVREYVFPPINMLAYENNVKNDDVSEEMHNTATKLVQTLASFKVKTKIVGVSRGPTITRYELSPEEGVKVRSIAGLVDDIALNLAKSGVRIEAPIPGKAAVGVEVPNDVRATVYLRELIDNPEFRAAKSKLNVSLGMDVAGKPVYLDIAKMPHLLVAGATGMGKSVSINSMIVSLLYKATPDEVKLILIDPKKVEFSLYEGLPHLLVPIVTEPKKAAGVLRWAETEMDRRYGLIEGARVRNIADYNKVTKDDPDKEFLPQIVIIIDELADLMATASKDVEMSISRIAAKARAAGMHLIIGTQRPSVDVVTGVIKANIPSRIACTMASQTDSRTIIDMGGAEKLIGRGDLLYAPVGSTKPYRVQGSFVSDGEIERIVEFIKKNSGVSSYNEEVISTIEKEAAKCGNDKKGRSSDFDGEADDSDVDALFWDAVEIAVDSGKMSTSLLQRRLQVGYGRAAKLIDAMEERGIVSAPEGSKPRSVLISRSDYEEMRFRQEG